MLNSKKIKQNNKGFSLIETIVAIAVLSIALLGPMTAAQKALLSASYSRDQMKAYYLAEEALEYIHYYRDKNALEEIDWLSGLNHCDASSDSSKSCGIDPLAGGLGNVIKNCTNLINCVLYFDSDTGLYNHEGIGDKTIFRRWVKLLNGSNSDEKKIEARVDWQTGPLKSKTIMVTGFINNWKEQPTY